MLANASFNTTTVNQLQNLYVRLLIDTTLLLYIKSVEICKWFQLLFTWDQLFVVCVVLLHRLFRESCNFASYTIHPEAYNIVIIE
jgi:hypothetical protein